MSERVPTQIHFLFPYSHIPIGGQSDTSGVHLPSNRCTRLNSNYDIILCNKFKLTKLIALQFLSNLTTVSSIQYRL